MCRAEAIRWREESAAEWSKRAESFDARAARWRSLGFDGRAEELDAFAVEARARAAVLRAEIGLLLAPALVAEMLAVA